MNTPNNKSELRSSNKNEISSFNVPEVLYNNRYCNQDDFNILICGGLKNGEVVRNCFLKIPSNFATTKELPPMLEPVYRCQTAVINSDIFVAGGLSPNNDPINSIAMFSYKNKVWRNLDLTSNTHYDFCICTFNKNLYIVGVLDQNDTVYQKTCCCKVYDIKKNKWCDIASTNQLRAGTSSCTVFEGKIVFTGGLFSSHSVETYDYHDNKWNYLPSMTDRRYGHSTVSMGNKLFVVGGYKTSSCEVFDSKSRKFVILKQVSNMPNFDKNIFKSVCIGDNIVVFIDDVVKFGTQIYSFDVCEEKWSHCDSKLVAKFGMSYVKYPMQ